jgi:hypothetical protein
VARVSTAGDVRVYLVGYIFCIIDYHICRDIFGRIYIMYCRLSYVSRGALPVKTPAPLYICTSIKQYNHLTFNGTPLSNKRVHPTLERIDRAFVSNEWGVLFRLGSSTHYPSCAQTMHHSCCRQMPHLPVGAAFSSGPFGPSAPGFFRSLSVLGTARSTMPTRSTVWIGCSGI